MGFQLAREAIRRKHRVTIVCGPMLEQMPPKAKVIVVETARQMLKAMRRLSPKADAIIMAAAGSDYEPGHAAKAKIKRGGRLVLELRATPDIVAQLPRQNGQIVAGFALETQNVLNHAKAKLRKKRLDLILAQNAKAGQGPFGRNALQAWLIERSGKVTVLGKAVKPAVARLLLDNIEALWYHQRGLVRPS